MVRKAQRHDAEGDELCSMSQDEGRNGLAGLFQGGNLVAAHWTRTEILRFVGGQTRQNDTLIFLPHWAVDGHLSGD